MSEIRRLHWGCGPVRPGGWINADIKEGPGIDISCNILDGLPLDSDSIDYISSQHALQELKILDVVDALRELHRVLKPGGVLRLCLPDLDKAIAAYRSARQDYFWCWDWDTISGNLITQMLDYNYTRTPFTYEFAEELLRKAGFRDVRRAAYRRTASSYPGIVELDSWEGDSREQESFYVEAFKWDQFGGLKVDTKEFSVSAQPSTRILAILGYHKIGEPPPGGWETWFFIPEETFAEHLRYLQENNWQVIDLETFLRGLEAPESLPEWAALLTFDDGYRSMRTVALPLLRRFGYPAVFFVPTDFIGGRNTFDADVEPEEAICDWDDLRQLERRGVSVQSHGASHRPFSELDLGEQEEELRRSKVTLEAGLEKDVEVFSFPKGDGGTNPRELGRVMQRIGYQAGCLYKGGPNRLPVSDPYRLPRLAIGPDTDLEATLG